MSGARFIEKGDIFSNAFPEMPWEEGATRCAHILYRWAEDVGITTLNWYMHEKRKKAKWSKRLRVYAAAFLTIGGLFPVVAVAASQAELAIWGYLFLGMGAAGIALDRVCGFSSSWMRYVSSGMAVQRILTDFQISWAERFAATEPRQEVEVSFVELLGEVRKFARELNELVERETALWVGEFSTNLASLESEASKL
ncbi:SLATT domain-containing protein [Microbispora siamensis]|uniref:SMODS and SLOG-associating 2TM effector domain-containing protein n=1 Tax=Microbispora siamensis TaxID=564413 RepID=A0ABQ4GTN3_9ACTN|nr:SLATT domain-containing protein [Microbispora siamensis]GIH64790.1 hypothetical protein Msi02_56070 [Microbispora siamensis]